MPYFLYRQKMRKFTRKLKKLALVKLTIGLKMTLILKSDQLAGAYSRILSFLEIKKGCLAQRDDASFPDP